uniref:Glycosyltransferase family 2 protein n=1 Tax=Desulfatirhabdium butyrativorans TaxID=340467 RepID=A0A7C4RR22_9BACT
MNSIEASIVMVLHAEGRWAHPAVVTALKAIERARDAGIDAELVLVLDRPDDATLRYTERYRRQERVRLVAVDFGDVGMARNEGIARSLGRWVSVMTPMHRMDEHWVVNAVCMLHKSSAERIARPEYLVVLGARHWVQRLIASHDAEFPTGSLLVTHVYRTGFCCAPQPVFEKFRYPAAREPMEAETIDWYWTCETLACGIGHVVVPQTVLFVHDSEGVSVENRSVDNHSALLQTSRLFDANTWKSVVG